MYKTWDLRQQIFTVVASNLSVHNWQLQLYFDVLLVAFETSCLNSYSEMERLVCVTL